MGWVTDVVVDGVTCIAPSPSQEQGNHHAD